MNNEQGAPEGGQQLQPVNHTAHAAASPPAHGGDYPSSPITTFTNAWKAIWQNGSASIWGVFVVQCLLWIVTALLALIAFVVILVLVINWLVTTNSELGALMAMMISLYMPPQVTEFMTTMSSAENFGYSVSIAVLASVFAAAVGAFSYSTGVAFIGMAVLKRQAANFGQVMSTAFKRTGPLVVLWFLVFVAFVVVGILIAAVGSGAGALSPILFLAALIAGVYFTVRLVMAPQAIVSLGMGPIQSLKHSWQLSKGGRWWEILGAVSVVSLLTIASGLAFMYLHQATVSEQGFALLVSLVELVVNLIITLLTIAVVAERMRQFTEAGASSHKVSYGGNVGMFIAAIAASIVGTIITGPALGQNMNPYGLPGSSQFDLNGGSESEFNSDTFNDEELQKELEQYYQETQDMYKSNSDYYDSFENDTEPTTKDPYKLN